MSNKKEKNVIPEDEILSSFDPPLKNIFSAEKKKDLSESYQQFVTNYAKGYGLFLMRNFIDIVSQENTDEPLGIPSLMDPIGIQDIINKCLEEHKDEIEAKMKQMGPEKIVRSFFSPANSGLLNSLMGFGFISQDTFLMEQSLIVLVISIETYFKDSIIELLDNNESLISKFSDEEAKIPQNIRLEIYKGNIKISEEIVKNLKLSSHEDISSKLQKRLGYSNFYLDKEHKKSIVRTFALRHSFVHRDGIVDKKLKNEIKCRYKLGNRYKIKEKEILLYYSHCFEIIKGFEKWKTNRIKIKNKKKK